MTALQRRDAARRLEAQATEWRNTGHADRARDAIAVASELRREAWDLQPSTRLPAGLNALGLFEPRYIAG